METRVQAVRALGPRSYRTRCLPTLGVAPQGHARVPGAGKQRVFLLCGNFTIRGTMETKGAAMGFLNDLFAEILELPVTAAKKAVELPADAVELVIRGADELIKALSGEPRKKE